MAYNLCRLDAHSRTYTKASQPTGWDVILGDIGSYLAMYMIKHSNTVELNWCVYDR